MPGRLLVLLSLLFCYSMTAAAQTSTRDLTYTTDAAGSWHADLYQPTGSGPFPAIVYIHGGAWRSGDKKSFSRLATDLAREGYVGLSIDYDLHAHSFPFAWEETRAAILFLRAHAAEYHLDPARIVVAGTSAGGELAALDALAPEGPATTLHKTPINVSAAIILNGVFELCVPAHVIKRYLGGTCAANKAIYDDASPTRHVHPSAPPFFIGHGTRDHVVPHIAAEMFTQELQSSRIPVTTFDAQGGPHMYWKKKPFYQQNLHAIETFLATTLKPASE